MTEEIQYIGEHLLFTKIGHFIILLGFVSALFSCLAYFFATNNEGTAAYSSWKKLGRIGFGLHGISIYTTIALTFYVMIQKYYEYSYVFEHVSDDLPFKYIFSAFWEGQEGSFMLWMFWHIFLGAIILFKGGKWEAPVLSVLMAIEVFINSMILGVYIGEYKIGSNPLALFRDTTQIPLFNNEDYISQLAQFADGLNPLLQNYWMTIHPPTLFLGFASTAIPFAFAIAGLWRKEHKASLKPMLRWGLFSGGILGTGILMGGAWAYEALDFGGYWAWDPVENTSLVPWLLVVAAIHVNLVAKATGYSIKSTYLFYILTFLGILYSTTLTRSGVLGDTSVHAFTEMGLEHQLLLFIIFFTIGSIIFMIRGGKSVPAPEKEETLFSKEFWMFMGALVLLFSSILITFTTSIPVYNKIAELFGFDLGLTSPLEPIAHYNKYQVWIAIFIGLFSGFSQFLRYREFNWKGHSKKFAIHAGVSLIIAGILTYITSLWIMVGIWQYALMLFFAIFTIITNIDLITFFGKVRGMNISSFTGHAGFGIMIIGIMASGLNKEHISTNPFAQRGLLPEDMINQNVLLIEDSPMFINGYQVTYEGDSIVDNTRYFKVNYQRIDKMGNRFESFDLYPNALYNAKFTKVASFNPSTKHYLDKDIFSHIAGLPPGEADIEEAKAKEDSLKYYDYSGFIDQPFEVLDTVRVTEFGYDTTVIKKFLVTIEGINKAPSHHEYDPEMGDLAVGLKIKVDYPADSTTYYAEPIIALRGSLLFNYAAQVNNLALKFKLSEKTLDAIFLPENQLAYQTFDFKAGDEINLNGYKINFSNFEKDPVHPGYIRKDGDIAVGAILNVTDPEGKNYSAQPVYLIRGNKPYIIKDEITELGFHFQFVKIDPSTGTVSVNIAQQERDGAIPFLMAANSFRDDYIVLEAIIFPGINLFWLGTIMMMVGLFIGMFRSIRDKTA